MSWVYEAAWPHLPSAIPSPWSRDGRASGGSPSVASRGPEGVVPPRFGDAPSHSHADERASAKQQLDSLSVADRERGRPASMSAACDSDPVRRAPHVTPIETRMLGAQVTVTTTEVQGCAVVTVVGELDIHTAPRLDQAISELVQEGVYDLVIDLTNLCLVRFRSGPKARRVLALG